MKRMILLSILFTVYTMAVSGSDEFMFEKKLSDNELVEGNFVTVTIVIQNNGMDSVEGELFDAYPEFLTTRENLTYVNAVGPVIYWNLTLAPGQKKEVTYTLDGRDIAPVWNEKNIPLPRAWFIDTEGNRMDSIFQNDLLYVETALPDTGCDYDFSCETERGEDYLNCPNDCGSSDYDLLCNDEMNGVCDPDCAEGVDPDCISEPMDTTTTFEASGPTTSIQTRETTSTSLAEGASKEEYAGSLTTYLALALTITVILIILILKIRNKREERLVEEDRKYLENLESETRGQKKQAR